MQHDEETTHAKLSVLLTDAVHPAIVEHGGRIVKNTGDGFLAEFPSAVEAVRAAVQFQTRINELTTAEVEDGRIAFRVGINVGEVIVEPHDIFGDGVNIAARLESIAEPGGICISSSAYDHIRGKVSIEFADLGERNLKNIARPIRAYAVAREGLSPVTKVGSTTPSSLSAPRLSMVVLPFANIGGDPEQDYFVDGVTESLTTDLSRITGSFVIGRHTAFTYKGMALDIKKIGRDLSVRYVLEGSVQRSGKRLRVNVQLVDAETANHLWADRFDKPLVDFFLTRRQHRHGQGSDRFLGDSDNERDRARGISSLAVLIVVRDDLSQAHICGCEDMAPQVSVAIALRNECFEGLVQAQELLRPFQLQAARLWRTELAIDQR
jgi:TolB-like protein